MEIEHGDGTRLYDAIDLVMTDTLEAIPERKAIVLFTDGVDTRSRLAEAAGTLARMQESQVVVYVILYTRQSRGTSMALAGMGLPSRPIPPEWSGMTRHTRAPPNTFRTWRTPAAAGFISMQTQGDLCRQRVSRKSPRN